MIFATKGVITMAFVMSIISLLAAVVAFVGYWISQKAEGLSEKTEQVEHSETHELVTSN